MAGSGMPVVRAILLADEVYQDLYTGKFIISGTFDEIGVPSFPGMHHSASSLYINLGDFHGSHELSVRLVRLEDGFEVDRFGMIQIEQEDRAHHAEFRLPLPPMQFEKAGPYALELAWDGDLLGECRIQVVEDIEL